MSDQARCDVGQACERLIKACDPRFASSRARFIYDPIRKMEFRIAQVEELPPDPNKEVGVRLPFGRKF